MKRERTKRVSDVVKEKKGHTLVIIILVIISVNSPRAG